jgi:hypothetical protein
LIRSRQENSPPHETMAGLRRQVEKAAPANSHEVAAKDACCCGVRWATFFGLQFQMD